MIVLDTHALVYDALAPARLSARARKAIDLAAATRELACCDISLWEIGMLVARGRLDPGMDARQFLDDLIAARRLRVLPITPEIAVLSQSDAFAHGDPADRLIAARRLRVLPITPEIAVLSQSDAFAHGDPADRLIAATALLHRAPLVTSDAKLRKLKQIATLW